MFTQWIVLFYFTDCGGGYVDEFAGMGRERPRQITHHSSLITKKKDAASNS